MSNDRWTTNADFLLPKENYLQALELAEAHFKDRLPLLFSRDQLGIEDVITEFCLTPLDAEGGLTLEFEAGGGGTAADALLEAIAPAVRPGSWIEWDSDDCTGKWLTYFNGAEAEYHDPVISYPILGQVVLTQYQSDAIHRAYNRLLQYVNEDTETLMEDTVSTIADLESAFPEILP